MKYLEAFLNGKNFQSSKEQEPTKPTKPAELPPMPGATFNGELWECGGYVAPTIATIKAYGQRYQASKAVSP
jgi:hypothetical protein